MELILTPSERRAAASLLLGQIERDGTVDMITVRGLCLCFDALLASECETLYTGVEFLGQRESYIRETVTVRGLRCTGVYDADGEDTGLCFDASSLSLGLESDWLRIVDRRSIPPDPPSHETAAVVARPSALPAFAA